MASNNLVTLVISGKSYPNIPKDLLAENSEYFKALFSGRFCDSNKATFHFPDWSTLAFEEVFKCMKNSSVSFKGKRYQILNNALRMSEFLCCNSFLRHLQRELIGSWKEIGFKKATYLALQLGINVEDDILNSSLERACSGLQYKQLQPEQGIPPKNLTHEELYLALSTDIFWNLEEYVYHGIYGYFLEFLTEQQKMIINWVLDKPPHFNNTRRLFHVLKLELQIWNNVKILLNGCGNPLSKKCLKLGYFTHIRKEIGNRISYLKLSLCAMKKRNKMTPMSVVAFNFNKWTWEMDEFQSQPQFFAAHCVTSGDCAYFMGNTGLVIYRPRDGKHKFINHVYIGQVFKKMGRSTVWEENLVTDCVVGKNIFLLVQEARKDQETRFRFSSSWYSKPTLFKLDVLNYEFDFCTELDANFYDSEIVGEGNKIYIAGFIYNHVDDEIVSDSQAVPPGNNFYTTTATLCDKIRKFRVLCFNGSDNSLTTIVEMNVFEETVGERLNHFVILQGTLLYIFFSTRYTIVDITKCENQILEFRCLQSFFTKVLGFDILQICAGEDGLTFLLNIKHSYIYLCDFGPMIAHLNTDSNEFKSLGFLPMWRNGFHEHFYKALKMEKRTSTSPPLHNARELVLDMF